MTGDDSEPRPPSARWHQALAYALLGRADPSLGVQRRPDPAALVTDLAERYSTGRDGLLQDIARARTGGHGWPYVLPDELRSGLGAAQFAAALGQLRQLLGLVGGSRPVVSERPLDASERALLREVPPHHGSG